MSQVSLVRIDHAEHDLLKQAIRYSLDLIQYSLPSKSRNIVIKPNMCYYWDRSTGQTADPRFVAALIDVLRGQTSSNVDISVVESDASAMKCKYAFKMLGYEKLAQDYNVRLVNLSEDQSDPIQSTAGGQSFHLMIPQIIQNADLRINVTKIKYSMENIKLTCALKNIFGCNPHPKKFEYHSKLEEAIVAINKAMKFDLHLIDGIIVSGIQSQKLGLVMASQDPVAIDAAAAKIADINPSKIRYLQLAHKEGLGNITFIPKGEPIEYFKSRYPRKKLRNKLMGKAYTIAVSTGLAERLGL